MIRARRVSIPSDRADAARTVAGSNRRKDDPMSDSDPQRGEHDGPEQGTTTGGASAFPGAPSAAPDEPAPGDGDVDTTTDEGGQPLENPSGG
jgi:hypothetical protein